MHPDRYALADPIRRVNYRDLNRTANRIRTLLKIRGVATGAVVAIQLKPSTELIAAMLGVLKTGAVYVYLDPAHPIDRRRYIAGNTHAHVLLTTRPFVDEFHDFEGDLLLLDGRIWETTNADDDDLSSGGSDEAVAFLSYTSGSTGMPKGVQCTHAGVTNRFAWFRTLFPFQLGDVALLRAQVSFVISAWEIFAPLLAGVQLVIVPTEVSKDPALLLHALRMHRVTHVGLVPSLASVLVEYYASELAAIQSLHVVEIGGESSPPGLLRRLSEILPSTTILHRYGSTEMTAVLCREVHPENTGVGRVPVGVPISSTTAQMLDEELRPVPKGVAGELYLAGTGMAQGYLNAPSATASRFVANPFPSAAGQRLYRTGDLARYCDNGEIELLGRVDFQIKFAGYRIEPSEIELPLMQHPAVHSALVTVARRAESSGSDLEETGGHVLVAYIVPQDPTVLSDGRNDQLSLTLREYLRQSLPHYLVPSRFIPMTALPLLPNGKTDRMSMMNRILDPEPSAAGGAPPQTIKDRILRDAAELLCSSDVVNASDQAFLDLGFDSIQAMRLAALLSSKYHMDVNLAELLDDRPLAIVIEHFCERSVIDREATVDVELTARTCAHRADDAPMGLEEMCWKPER